MPTTAPPRNCSCTFTPFPSLHSTTVPDPSPSPSPSSSSVETATVDLLQDVDRRTLMLAWAMLLRAHSTTADDRIAFAVVDCDSCAVCNVTFDDMQGRASIEETASTVSGCCAYTAVSFASDTTAATSLQLCLSVEHPPAARARPHAVLVASRAIVPPAHLPALARQLGLLVSSVVLHCADAGAGVGSSTAVPAVGFADVEEAGLSTLNPRPTRLPGPALLHELVARPPPGPEADRCAIDFLHADGLTRSRISYAQLHALSDAFATRIALALTRSAAAPPSEHRTVPVLLQPSCALYVVQLAILKAGAAFVPLGLDAPAERLRFVVADVCAAATVASPQLAARLRWDGAPPIILFDDALLLDALADLPLPLPAPLPAYPPVAPAEAAYVMYTSGSTGQPKGVVVSHAAAAQSLLAHAGRLPSFARFLQLAAPTFDVAVFDTFFPWLRRATLVGCDRTRLLQDLPGAINALAVDAVELTPTVAAELLGRRAAVPTLRLLLTIGEMLTPPLVADFGGAGLLHGMYGPTEAAIHCTLAAHMPAHARVGDIGVPLDTVSAFVLSPPRRPASSPAADDPDVEVLPVGWVGELAVGGWQLADGYLGRPELTRAAFVQSARWGRLYRTGDRARMLPAGRIEILGRLHVGQVKLRGQRVELGEVESAALRTPGVRAAVASVAVAGRLVVHVSAGGEVDGPAVKETCRRVLPGFMVPSDVVVHADLPRLSSGKADRQRLDQDYARRDAAQNPPPPALPDDAVERDPGWSDVELAVAGAVEKLLSRRPRAKHASLTALGLDSIQAIRLVARLRACGLPVGAADVVTRDTIAGIAAAAAAAAAMPVPLMGPGAEVAERQFAAVNVAGWQRIPAALAADVQDVIPCSALQEAMVAETARDSAAYCNWVLLELPASAIAAATAGPFAAVAATVEGALRSLIQRNEILRSGFVALDDGGFAQVVWKTSRPHQFRVVDALVSDWQLSPVLDGGLLEPPFAAHLLGGSEQQQPRRSAWQLGIRLHHALYDGWAWENMVADLRLLLLQAATGRNLPPPPPPPPRPQFRAVVRWELAARTPDLVLAAKQFWRALLADAADTRLPSFHGRSDVPARAGAGGVSVHRIRLSTPRVQLESAARQSAVSAQVPVQAAWAYLLSTYTGQTDVMFGTVASGRTAPVDRIGDILGPTILTLPVRIRVGQRRSVAAVLRELHVANRRLLEPRAQLPLAQIRRECCAGGGGAWFDSLVVWQQTANELPCDGDGALRVVETKDRLEVNRLPFPVPHPSFSLFGCRLPVLRLTS